MLFFTMLVSCLPTFHVEARTVQNAEDIFNVTRTLKLNHVDLNADNASSIVIYEGAVLDFGADMVCKNPATEFKDGDELNYHFASITGLGLNDSSQFALNIDGTKVGISYINYDKITGSIDLKIVFNKEIENREGIKLGFHAGSTNFLSVSEDNTPISITIDGIGYKNSVKKTTAPVQDGTYTSKFTDG